MIFKRNLNLPSNLVAESSCVLAFWCRTLRWTKAAITLLYDKIKLLNRILIAFFMIWDFFFCLDVLVLRCVSKLWLRVVLKEVLRVVLEDGFREWKIF